MTGFIDVGVRETKYSLLEAPFLYLARVSFLCCLTQVYTWMTLKVWEEGHMLMGGREEAYGETCQHSFIMTPNVIPWPSKV